MSNYVLLALLSRWSHIYNGVSLTPHAQRTANERDRLILVTLESNKTRFAAKIGKQNDC